MKPKFINWYTYTGQYLNIRLAIILFASEIILAIIGYMLLEDYSVGEAIYMTIITISTVGYGEVRELSDAGRYFTTGLIMFNFGIFAYAVSAFTSFVVYGEFFKSMHANVIQKEISKLKSHIIICGFGRYGSEIVHNFLNHKVEFVVIENDHDAIEQIQKSKERILYIEDDATHDEALIKAGVKEAKALITALPEDSDNLLIALTVRQLNPDINIISRAKHHKTVKKLETAGASHVIMPEQIGGFYMATLVNKPDAVEFFSFVTNQYESDMGFEELTYSHLPHPFRNYTLRDLQIREKTGANVIGLKKPEGGYSVNPGPETKITENSSYIVLGNSRQLESLRQYIKSLGK